MAHPIPEGAFLKEITAHYNQSSIPLSLRRGLELMYWVRLVVEAGSLRLYVGKNAPGERITPQQTAVIPAGECFWVEAEDEPVRFYLEYHDLPALADGAELARLLSR